MGIFSQVPIKKPRRSSFDKSYYNLFTCNMGELVPAYVEPIIPDDYFEVGARLQVRFPALVNPIFGEIDAKIEYFWVPNRLVMADWKYFITNVGSSGQSAPSSTRLPFYVYGKDSSGNLRHDTSSKRLADYLGARDLMHYSDSSISTGSDYALNALPFRAYGLIWNEYYRDENLDSLNAAGTHTDATGRPALNNVSLLKRRWSKDYFTSATNYPQQSSSAASVDVTITQNQGTFTIAAFRVASALQNWLERSNLGGHRYIESILSHFGVMPADSDLQRPEFLGSISVPVIVNPVAQTSYGLDDEISGETYNNVGNLAGVMSAVGSSPCFKRRFKEHGYVIGLFSVCPRAIYATGTDKHLFQQTYLDFPWPEFCGIGDEPIYNKELYYNFGSSQNNGIFGYNQRYATYKIGIDQCHGDFASAGGLPTYSLARYFNALPSLISSFLEMNPRSDIFAYMVNSEGEDFYTCWVNLYNVVKCTRSLPEFSLPTLTYETA